MIGLGSDKNSYHDKATLVILEIAGSSDPQEVDFKVGRLVIQFIFEILTVSIQALYIARGLLIILF